MVLVGTTRGYPTFSKYAFLGRSLPIRLHLLNHGDIRSAIGFKLNEGSRFPFSQTKLTRSQNALTCTSAMMPGPVGEPLRGDLGNLNSKGSGLESSSWKPFA